ncbi:MAG: nitroreductase [Clostridia bacterium]|nr:nitroreductase [Clostridia bacterium]
MNPTLETLKTRRSCRKYLARPVEEETLCAILEAGMYAPTGKNRMAPKMVVVRDKETIAAISRMNAAVMGTENDPFYGAPTLIIVFADREVPTYVEDGALVMGNLMNAAHALGVDSCWIHRARQVFETEEGRRLMEKWGVGENYAGIGNCILGYRDGEHPEASPRKEDYVLWV